MKNREALIGLSVAHVTQLTGNNGEKGPWRVQANKTNETLMELDKNYTEKQVFEILDFARKYELVAFNAGIKFQKRNSDTHWKKIENGLLRVNEELAEANKHLADKLDNLIGE